MVCSISIDLPACRGDQESTDQMRSTTLPAGLNPGWVIPDDLRDRHRLLLGDSKQLLPGVCSESGPIDIFLHDSLHTYGAHVLRVQRRAGLLEPGGLLLSDDVFWNAAFYDFCRLHQLSYATIPDQLGAVRAASVKAHPERQVAAEARSSSVHAQIPSPTPPEERHG